MDFYEKTIATKEIFDGKIIKVRVDTVELPNGNTSTREIVSHPGGVGVVALDENNNVYMVRQFRKPLDKVLLEVPAGKLDGGEDPRICGIRELEEETGMCARSFEPLGEFYPSVGFSAETLYLYIARDLYPGKVHPDEDEFLEVEKIPLDTLVEMVMDGRIKDGKTIVAILKAKLYLEK
ncbi:MAG: NUDIX hydrolase [Ruminococcaceae bacterium]|nr:NUDIX hydrolase [Oscillospiraceae bacterium]